MRSPLADAIAALAYWSAAARYAEGKIEETFGLAEEEIRARGGARMQGIAEDAAICLRSFLERLHRREAHPLQQVGEEFSSDRAPSRGVGRHGAPGLGSPRRRALREQVGAS